VAGSDGAVRPLLFDSSPLLASAVFAGPDGGLLVGVDAERAAVGYPAGFEPNPKRHIDDGTVWLGERECPVVNLVAAVLGRVAGEVSRVAGRSPDEVVLSHPATWGRARIELLAKAAGAAGLSPVRFVAEPVAAAAYFASVLGRELPAERYLVVYDLGAGTFDVSVIGRSPSGFEVVASDGLADVGGLDLDAAVVGHCRASTADGSAWTAHARKPNVRRATACGATPGRPRNTCPATPAPLCTFPWSTPPCTSPARISRHWRGPTSNARSNSPGPYCERPMYDANRSAGCCSSAAPRGSR
jgi:Hsp70 protein